MRRREISRLLTQRPCSRLRSARSRDDLMKRISKSLSVVSLVFVSGVAWTVGQHGPGAASTEIKIGNTMPYSGPASSYGVIGKSEAAYFAMINEQGGINGRKINFISRDDGYSPRRPSNRYVRWLRKTRSCCCSRHLERRPTLPSII